MAIHSLVDLAEWLATMPQGTLLPVDALRELIPQVPVITAETTPQQDQTLRAQIPWRENFWRLPHETRIGCAELAEALGRSRSWVYKRTQQQSATVPLPYHKIENGALEFVVGEIRGWLARVDVVAHGATLTNAPPLPLRRDSARGSRLPANSGPA